MKQNDVIDKLREMYVRYTEQSIGLNPALLPEYLAEFLGYTNLLYSHYAEFIVQYRLAEAKVLAEENDSRDLVNKKATGRDDKRTVDEKNDRITIRLSELKGNRERLETEIKSASTHITTIQSLLKRQSEEARSTL